MARKVFTDKYLWVVIFLVVVGILVLIVYNSIAPDPRLNLPPQLVFDVKGDSQDR